MQDRLVILSVCAFLLGVSIRTQYEVQLASAVWILLISFVLSLVWRRKRESFSAPNILLASICLLFFSLGIVRTEIASWNFSNSPLEQSLNQTVTLTGIITTEPDYRERSVHLYVEVGEDKILVTTDRLQVFSYGDEVEVLGKINRPESFVTELGRTFDYPSYLLAKGTEYTISFAKVKVINSNLGNPIIANLLSAKKNFIESLQLVIPEPQVGLGNGLLLGVRSALGEDIEEDFRRTGIIHIVVLSGYNVMLVVAFIMFCFSFLLPFRFRVVAGIVAIISFALVVGLSATVVRASIMASLVLLAQVLGRRYNVLRALLLAGAAMIFINPYLLLYDIGFQLSFMATLGLILIIPQFESTVMTNKSRLGLREFFLATLATQIAVFPLLMYHIGQVSLIALLVNVLVLPVVPLAMLLTFFTGLIGLVSINVASLFGYLATISLSYILLMAEWFASLTFAAITVPQFSALGVFLMYTFMVALWYFIKVRRNHPDNLSGWIIEAESKSAGEFLNTSSEDSPADAKLPIFFR